MLFIELKKKRLFIFLIFIFFISSCGIRERLKEKPVVTYVEKPPELLMQDARRFMQKKNYSEAARTFEEIDKPEYERLLKYANQIDLTKIVEIDDNTNMQGEIACAGVYSEV